MIRLPTALALSQFPIAFGVMVGAMFYPTAGSAAVLIAPGEDSAVAAIEWARAHQAPMLGLAAGGTAPVVRLSGGATAIDALLEGFIPVAADLATCGTSQQAKGFRG